MQTGAANNNLHRFFLADRTVRGAILDGTALIQEMQALHHLGPLETLILGQGLLAVALMASSLKGLDEIGLRLDCSGPVKGLLAEGTATGEVRGYLKQNPIPLPSPDLPFAAVNELLPLWGEGFLVVTRFLEETRHPFSGSVALQSGRIAREVGRYYSISEQIATALHLSVAFDSHQSSGRVTGAGGLLVQAMPDAAEGVFADIEQKIHSLPALAQALAAGTAIQPWLREQFPTTSLEMLATTTVRYQCRCSNTRMRRLLAHLSLPDLEEMRDFGPFPVQLTCHFCSTVYSFDQEDLADICREKEARPQ